MSNKAQSEAQSIYLRLKGLGYEKKPLIIYY